MADIQNSESTTQGGSETAKTGEPAGLPPSIAGDRSLTAERQIGVKADDMGDNDIVTMHGDQKGHRPTGGAEH